MQTTRTRVIVGAIVAARRFLRPAAYVIMPG
jgi:hypothetical protein